MVPEVGSLDRRRVLVALAVVALVALAGCDGQANRNGVVCLSCATAEQASLTPGGAVAVDDSELAVRVHENGSSRWRARVTFADASAETLDLAADRIRGALREGSFGTGSGVAWVSIHDEDEIENVRTETDPGSDSLVVTYTVPDAAHRTADGTLVVDYFHDKHDRSLAPFSLGADRVELRGPPGWAATNTPDNATRTDDGAVVWTGAGTRIDENTYVTFARNRGPGTIATGRGAVAVDLLGWRGAALVVASLLPVLVLTGAGLAMLSTGLGLPAREEVLAGRTLRDPGPGTVASVVLGAVAVLGTVVVLPLDWSPYRILAWAAPVPILAFAVLGVATEREHWAAWPALASLALTPVVAVSLHVFSAGGLTLGTSTTALVALVWTAVVTTAGAVVFFLARWASGRLG